MRAKSYGLGAVVLLGLCLAGWAAPLVHDWSQRFGDSSAQLPFGVATDSDGNVVVTGVFYGTVDFGGGVLTSAGERDIFIAKFDAAGNHLWSKSFGDGSAQYESFVAVDDMGNVIIAGYFQSTVNFGGGVLTSAGGEDIFVAKFDALGNHLWSKRFGDSGHQIAYGVAVDAQGNVLLTGYFSGTVDFGGGVLTSAGVYDVYVAKLDAAGNHVWSRRFGDADSQYGWSVAADASGNVVLTGNFFGAVDFGGGTLTSGGSDDIFLAKFDASGAHLWSQRFGGAYSQYARSVAVDDSGNVILTGDFVGTVDFGGGAISSAGLSQDIYVAKFDPAGNHTWSKGFGDTGWQYSKSVKTDFLGNIVATGDFFSAVDFGGGPLVPSGNADFYVARFDPAGNHVWSRRFGDTTSQYAQAVTTDGWGNAIVAGYFMGSVNFGGTTLTASGGNDIFVAKFWRAAPLIHAVRDVPGDQGGLVNVSWRGSGGDTPQEHVITHYTVWRAIDPSLAAEMMAAGAEGRGPIIRLETIGATTYYWYLITSHDAYYLTGYSAPVPTLFDSTAVCDDRHYFQVIAHTSTPWVFCTSDPDSGYSVDNLAPAPPAGFAGEQSITPEGLKLIWRMNHETDLSHYALYRGTTFDFVAGAGNLVASLSDTTLFDDEWRWDSGYYYKLSALDIHGNESAFAVLIPEGVTGIGDGQPPSTSYLAQNYPNPCTSTTRFSFGLSEATDVSLRVYDVSGCLVRVLVDERRGADRYQVVWDGRGEDNEPVASGVYFVRLKAGRFVQTRKIVVTR